MTYEEKLKLATDIAPTAQFSVDEIIAIIDEAIISLEYVSDMGYSIDTTIDEEYVQKLLWVKTIKAKR